jgi:aspartyl-tRNA(Asn)/glutamyl-tRNA(Gln) amidotransferase subunit A
MTLPQDLADATAVETVFAIAAGQISARERAEAALARIEADNTTLNAFTEVTRARALAEADAVDASKRADLSLGPLAGVPFAVKNLFDLEGIKTLAGSKLRQNADPAPSDATLVQRLTSGHAVTLGALNMGEFAYDFTGENVHYGPSRNPHDPSRMAGGSSGGSGAAVGGGLVPLSLGSDTNGSIRVPSAFCGIFGLKPTYGRLSRAGTFPFVDSLDHLGPMARSVADLALAFDAMQGPDPLDPVCNADASFVASLQSLEEAPQLRVARLGGWFRGQGEPASDTAADKVAQALGAVEDLEIDGVASARAAAFVITNVEGAALHLDDVRATPELYDPFVRDRLLAGALMPGVHYVRAQRARLRFQQRMAKVFERFDLLVAPTTPMSAPKLGAETVILNGTSVPLRPNIGIYTQPISFIGLPVVSCPVWSASVPYGVQLIAPAWREDIALGAAHHLQTAGICTAFFNNGAT